MEKGKHLLIRTLADDEGRITQLGELLGIILHTTGCLPTGCTVMICYLKEFCLWS